ncbi:MULTISPECIES: type II toxin-antitoxin system RelE/ParE family toxin [Pasteurellaceae]|uniref:Type II toxin-antitoxin system RelE/ParE family toxin n=1 Tax=Pasteurella atlantica TaxID=2827233 RepID=A0AAW8CN63_9PAST|nr:type II toxin-antitoxin system RelE/ParE family toxin [Pasteurella atlantica]MBR0573000.1 type II toxin-antitoxin system RelE/ParE family toxin [Pasteurella atlantica]MDP8038873.1 type II toxin-antitoxin system RelE/ParE family toxin [Pasteurella atlantica]MDP8041018.1 type II toxin-antitoxin system RelE/ParE family toxin [Pasteurella atlantica]MDP8043154.1 type II toxin-antitoxin system RelE/ParE family toxin [Pasteurella atlantica]MDP8045240.1 type II toxin-antitoxin system RelE/ParE fami
MTKIIVSPKVIDLINKYAFQLSEFTGYKETGDNFKQQCYDAIESLTLFPERYRQYVKYSDFRELIVGNHIILYRYDRHIDTVFISNIKNTKQEHYM